MYGVNHKMLFGCDSIHLPINLIFQDTGDKNVYAGVFQGKSPLIRELHTWVPKENQNDPHLLVIADVILRPQIIVTSKHLLGNGIANVYTSGFMLEDWIDKGDTHYVYEERHGGKKVCKL